MKLNANKNNVFTLNQTLNELSFDDKIEVHIRSICGRVFLGRESSDRKFEHIQIYYKPKSIIELKYLYHVKILGAGLKYRHLAYVKATWFQHIQIWFVNRFVRFITNFENIFKILTVMGFIIPLFINNNTNVNIYMLDSKMNKINDDPIINSINYIETTKSMVDTIHIQ